MDEQGQYGLHVVDVNNVSISLSFLCFCCRCYVQAEVMQDFTRRCQYPSLECVRKASSSHRHPPGTGFLDGSSRRRTATGEGTKLTRNSSSSSSNNTIRHLSTARGPTDDSSIENCSSDEDTTTAAAAKACYPSSN